MKIIDVLNALRKQPGGRPVRARLEDRDAGPMVVLEVENRSVPGDKAARFEAVVVLPVMRASALEAPPAADAAPGDPAADAGTGEPAEA